MAITGPRCDQMWWCLLARKKSMFHKIRSPAEATFAFRFFLLTSWWQSHSISQINGVIPILNIVFIKHILFMMKTKKCHWFTDVTRNNMLLWLKLRILYCCKAGADKRPQYIPDATQLWYGMKGSDEKCPELTLPKNDHSDSKLFDMAIQPEASSSPFPKWESKMLFIFFNIVGLQRPCTGSFFHFIGSGSRWLTYTLGNTEGMETSFLFASLSTKTLQRNLVMVIHKGSLVGARSLPHTEMSTVVCVCVLCVCVFTFVDMHCLPQ